VCTGGWRVRKGQIPSGTYTVVVELQQQHFTPRIITCVPPHRHAFPSRFLSIFYRVLGIISRCRVVYVESIARVTRLSLSARILYHLRIADAVFVQWEELASAYPRTRFAGRLM
jgi:beta-1,4-N-acetylglucosaminyltransferase